MIPSRDKVRQDLIAVIEGHHGGPFDSHHEDLTGAGIMDSYTMLLLVNFVHSNYEITLDMEKIDFDVFKKLDTFIDLVFEAKR